MTRRRQPVYTFPASEFFDKPLVVFNSGAWSSFVDVGAMRVPIAAGEEKSFDVPRGAEYLIGLGPMVRLAELGLEVLKR